jgi:PAS domain S-box-containing protein
LAEEKAGAKHLEFLAGGGEMGAMMRRHDWAATPLGSPERWPASLRTAVSMVIGSQFPACLVWGPELVTIYNDAFRSILAGKPEALGRPFSEVWSEAWDKLGHFAEAALAGEAVFIENFPLVVERNGYPEQAYFTFCYSPVRDETGRIAGFLDTVIETTGQVRAEQAFRAGQTRQTFLLALGDRLRTLSEPGDIMLVAAEMLGRHIGVARAGYGEIDISGEVIRVERDWANGVPSLAGEARLLEGFGAAIAAELRAGRTLTVKDSGTDPRAIGSGVAEVWASIDLRAVVAVPLVKGGRFVAFLYLHDPQPRPWTAEEEALAREVAERTWDAVERARAEAALRASEARFRLMADAVPQIIWITDGEGRVEFFNRQWFDYTGAPADAITAADVASHFLHPDDASPTMAAFDEARRTGGTFLVEHRIRSLIGEYRWFLVRGEPHRDPRSNEILSWYGASIDIHDRKLTEQQLREFNETLEARVAARTQELEVAHQQLRQAQKMEAMGQLTGGVAHDFNNLLTPIIGTLDLLQRRGVGGEREQRLIAGAVQSAERAKTLVHRLLAFARRQPLQPTAVDVAKLVTDMADLVASTTGPQIQVVCDVADDLPPAKADPNQLEMALLNLSVNARDAMPDGGTLRITASAETISGPRHQLRPGRYVRLSVADTGIGMSEATLARAVEPFFSTKGIGKGTGLGLSMVHGLASQLGGTLTISSRPGLGTNVELWLRESDDVPKTPPPVHDAPLTSSRGTALLVDDEELVRLSTADMLADLGYDVLEADSAEAAMDVIRNGARLDIVVTDHLMPKMTGADLARAIKAMRPGVPVLVISGYAESEGIEPALSRLSKPFRKDELAASLASLMGNRQ